MLLFINPRDWGRQTERVDQALDRLAYLEHRLDKLVLAFVAGVLTLTAAIVGAVVLAVMGG